MTTQVRDVVEVPAREERPLEYEKPLFEEDDGLIFPVEIWRSLEGAQGCMQCSSCHGCRT